MSKTLRLIGFAINIHGILSSGSTERAAGLKEMRTLLNLGRVEPFVQYLSFQDPATFYPAYEEQQEFLLFLSELTPDLLSPLITSIKEKPFNCSSTIFRLLDIPQYAFDVTQAHMDALPLQKFLLALKPCEIPLSLMHFVELKCVNEEVKNYCKMRSSYFAAHAPGLSSKTIYWAIKMIFEQKFKLKRLPEVISQIPLLYHMYWDQKTVMERLLEDPAMSHELLNMATVPVFQLSRVDNNVSCRTPLSNSVVDKSTYDLIVKNWLPLPAICLNPQENSSNSKEALDLYRRYEENLQVLYSHYLTNPITAVSDLPENAVSYYGQQLASLLSVHKHFAFSNQEAYCWLLKNKDAIFTDFWNPRTNKVFSVLEAWGTQATEQCGVKVLKDALETYVTHSKSNERPLPSSITDYCFPSLKQSEINVNSIALTADLTETELDQLLNERQIELEALKTREQRWSVDTDPCNSLALIIPSYFNDSHTSLDLLRRLARHYDIIFVNYLTQKKNPDLVKSKVFNQFLNLTTTRSVTSIVETRWIIETYLTSFVSPYRFNDLVSILFYLSAKNLKLQQAIKNINSQEIRKLSWRARVGRWLDPIDKYEALSSQLVVPYHVTLIKTLTAMAQDVYDSRGNYYNKNASEVIIAKYNKKLKSVKEKVISCYTSLLTIILNREPSLVQTIKEQLEQEFKPTDSYFNDFLKHKVCIAN